MVDFPVNLRDRDDNNFSQLGAKNGSDLVVPAEFLCLYNAGSPIPVDNTNPLPVRQGTGVTFANNISQIGGASYSLGQGAAGVSAPVVLATRHESVTTPLAVQLSNGSSAFDFNSGTAGSTTLRTVLATRHESPVTPLSTRITPDGVSFYGPQTYIDATLSAPGFSSAKSFANYRRGSCFFTVANINSFVTVRVEGRAVIGSGNWFSLFPRSPGDTSQSEVIVGNGDYVYYFELPCGEVRFNFVNESGGTSATIDVLWRFER
jgi:hypothetical protein